MTGRANLLWLLGAVALASTGLYLALRPPALPSDPALPPSGPEEPQAQPHAEPREDDEGPEEEPGERPPGRFHRVPGPPATAEQAAAIAELNSIGYAAGSEPAPPRSGVTVHDAARASAGTNLYTSGHAPGAVLMEMDGRVLHAWSADVREVWPEEELEGRELALVQFWRRAFLCRDGELLAIFEGHSLIKLDRHSSLIWRSRCRAHHDLEVLPDGDILVLTRQAHVVPEFNPERPILEDFVTRLDANGNEKGRFSLLEALEASPYAHLRERARLRSDGIRHQRGDILHANSLAVLDGRLAARIPAFREGNLLVSSRPLSFIGVVDPAREELVWTMQGSFREQHDPKVLPGGNLLLFDNSGLGEASRVMELDPSSGAVVWEYRGTPEAPFFTRTCGAAERLPNGNTLITESDGGRAFEVTAAGEIVWEFWNPARAGDHGELVATLFEVVRLPPDQPLDWLERR
jgi:hypothetical protein